MNITIDWGHKYGRPFGFKAARQAAEKVRNGEWELVRKSKWRVNGPKGGLQHGYEATYRTVR